MGITVSLLLLAAGAVLALSSGIDLNAIGGFLIALGAAGAVFSLLFWSSWGGFTGRGAPPGRLG